MTVIIGRVERLQFGTSTIGDAKVILVTPRREAARGAVRTMDTLNRYAARQWAKVQSEWHAVGPFEMTRSDDAGDLFIRGLAAYRITRQAIKRTPWERQ